MTTQKPELTVDLILLRISHRLVVLGNKTHSKKASPEEKHSAGVVTRELLRLRDWIRNNGSKTPPKQERQQKGAEV